MVEDPTKGLSESIGGVDDARDVGQDDIVTILPVLYGKHLYVNVSATFSRNAVIDHVDSGHVIFVYRSRVRLCIPKLVEDGAKVQDCLGSGDGSDEFSFSTTCGSNRLCLAAVGDDTTSKAATVTGSGAAIAKIIGMGCINVREESERIVDRWERWKHIISRRMDRCFRTGC